MSHGVLSPHWGWRNIRVGLDEEHAALLQTTFFRSEAFVEIHRDAYYGAAGKRAVMRHQLPRRLLNCRCRTHVHVWRVAHGMAKIL